VAGPTGVNKAAWVDSGDWQEFAKGFKYACDRVIERLKHVVHGVVEEDVVEEEEAVSVPKPKVKLSLRGKINYVEMPQEEV
jgi:hypothetical protein